MNFKKRGIDIIPQKIRKKNDKKNTLFPKNTLFFHVNSYSEERKISCLKNNLVRALLD